LSLDVQRIADVSIAIVPEAYARRSEAIESARFITAVNSDFGFSEAAEALKALHLLQKDTETTRKAVKAPVLDLGKKIDATAAEFLRDIDAEAGRLKQLMTVWQVEQDRKRAEAERKRQEEEAKARRAEEARLAEIRKQEEEARRAEENAKNEIERRAAEERRKAAQAQADAEVEAAKVREATAPVAITIAAPKPAGVAVRRDWDFEVTDLKAFAAAHPDLVTITPKRADIIALLRTGTRELTGARVFESTKVGVRS
jgi:hypothetical protein